MEASYDYEESVVLVTGVSGALGGAIAEAFDAAGATVCGADIVAPDDEDALVDPAAVEFLGTVRANAVMPSVIDTPMNREMMPDADHDEWVDPADIADVVLFLCSSEAGVTSGAAVPAYGEA